MKHQLPKERYVYEQLDTKKPQVRLLRIASLSEDGRNSIINCELGTFVRESAPSYTALSYTWGSNLRDCTICLNARSFAVTKNLWRFLYHDARLDRVDGYLWIDAICIDQGNQQERTEQVNRMAQTYKQAQSVLVWLGPAYAGSDEILSQMRNLKLQTKQWEKIRRLHSLPLHNLFALCRRSYWKRLWIFQELMLARKITLFCGSRKLAWDCFVVACFESEVVLRSENANKSHALRRISENSLFTEIWTTPAYSIAAQLAREQNGRSLWDLMLATGHLRCLDPRDKVYALLGVAKHGTSGIEPRYDRPLVPLAHDVLRNHHDIESPSLDQINDQFKHLERLFGVDLATVSACGTTGKSGPPEVSNRLPGQDVSLAIFADSTLSLWSVVHYRHDAFLSLMKLELDESGRVRLGNDPWLSGIWRSLNMSIKGDDERARVSDSKLDRSSYNEQNTSSDIEAELFSDDNTARSFDKWRSPLHNAVIYKHHAALGCLLSSAIIPINCNDSRGETALSLAVRAEDGRAVELLLQYPECRIMTSYYYSVDTLTEAMSTGNITIWKTLLARVSAEDCHRSLALHHAADSSTVKALVKAGADVNIADKMHARKTPLHRAKSADVAVCLLDCGADISHQDKYGSTPLHDVGSVEVASVLLKNDADVNAMDKYGQSPLLRAVRRGGNSVELATLLLENGADIHAVDEKYRAPLRAAVVSRRCPVELIALLLENGAAINGDYRCASTPLDHALQRLAGSSSREEKRISWSLFKFLSSRESTSFRLPLDSLPFLLYQSTRALHGIFTDERGDQRDKVKFWLDAKQEYLDIIARKAPSVHANIVDLVERFETKQALRE